MITLITGAPGTGKSNAVVSMLSELGKDRPVYVFGIPDLKIPHLDLEDPTTWPDSVPDGACIVLDEVQNVWRPRGPGQKVPEHVSKLETHRHRGLDFYIITQGPNLVDANVRALTGRHVHLRDLGILGRWWYEWPECADNCRTAWKNAPIKKRYRLDKAAQKQYRSASIHVKPVRSIPWMLAVMVIALVLVAFMSFKAYGVIQGKMAPPKAPGTSVADTQQNNQVNGAPGAPAAATAKFIDDRVDFVPRVASKPESAPVYDGLRQVLAMPRVAGAMVMGKKVLCVTQQGTDAGLSESDCRAWMASPPFNPYEAPRAADPSGIASGGNQTPGDRAPGAGPTAVVMDAGIERPGVARSKSPG